MTLLIFNYFQLLYLLVKAWIMDKNEKKKLSWFRTRMKSAKQTWL